MFKAGTVKELSKYRGMMNGGLYEAALRLVKILDKVYGADRDVDGSDEREFCEKLY